MRSYVRFMRLRLTGVRYLLKHFFNAGADPQITQITLKFKKLTWLDRLKTEFSGTRNLSQKEKI